MSRSIIAIKIYQSKVSNMIYLLSNFYILLNSLNIDNLLKIQYYFIFRKEMQNKIERNIIDILHLEQLKIFHSDTKIFERGITFPIIKIFFFFACSVSALFQVLHIKNTASHCQHIMKRSRVFCIFVFSLIHLFSMIS